GVGRVAAITKKDIRIGAVYSHLLMVDVELKLVGKAEVNVLIHPRSLRPFVIPTARGRLRWSEISRLLVPASPRSTPRSPFICLPRRDWRTPRGRSAGYGALASLAGAVDEDTASITRGATAGPADVRKGEAVSL